MKHTVIATAIALALASSAALAAEQQTPADLVARGKILVMFGGCHDCHTPKNMTPQGPVPNMSRQLSGHPAGQPLPPVDKKALTPGYWMMMTPDFQTYVGPWGISYPANLTPDEQTGNRSVDGGHLHPDHEDRQTHGHRPSDPSADDHGKHSRDAGQRSQGDLCVPALDPAHQERGAATGGAARCEVVNPKKENPP